MRGQGGRATVGRRLTAHWERYNMFMEKTVRVFSGFAEADEADARWDEQLTPSQRIQLVIELRDRRHPDAVKQGLARVCRIVKLQQS
jgi:hypothetical protein